MVDFLSVDPGSRSGISLCSFSETEPLEHLQGWDVPGGTEGFIDWVVDNEPAGVQFIVYETFTLHGGKGTVLDSVEVIGALKVLAHELEIPLHPQPPAGRVQAVPDEVLYRFDDTLRGKAHRNEKESLRHALWYMKKKAHVPTLLKGWPRND